MRLVTFVQEAVARPGMVLPDGKVLDLSQLGFHTLLDFIAAGSEGKDKAQKFAAETHGASYQLKDVKLQAPIPKPRKLICIGLNYLDHARETNSEIPKVPTVFSKFATAVIAQGENVVLPRVSNSPDYEAEFAFVIGKGGRAILADSWRDHVYGYTIINDISARDYQRATTQWLMGKTFDTFAPMGPWIVTADEIDDPHNLDIQMEINGEILQDSNTRELIFKIPELIAYLSSVFTLEPGDIISTGTPAGVGVAREPQRFLRPGDRMTVKIPALGELTNPVIAES